MKRSGTELEALLSEARGLLDRLEAQVWVKGADCRFHYVNAAFTGTLGCRGQEEAVGEHERSLFSRAEAATFRDSDRAALDLGRPVVVMEPGPPKEVWRSYETLKLPIVGAAAKPVATLGIAWDVSLWARVRQRLHAAAAALPAAEDDPDPEGPLPIWLLDAVRRLTENGGGGVPAARIAAALGIHPDSLGRAFQRRFGVRLAAYRRSLRAASARDGIVQTGSPLVDVALDAGFADQAHMTREIKSAYGITPGALRALAARASPRS